MSNNSHHLKGRFPLLSVLAILLGSLLSGCIKNDIPYPYITQMILAIAAEGQEKEAYIDSIAFEVNIYLEETTDIENVCFTEYRISTDGVSDPNLLEGTYDLSKPLAVTLSRFQDYTWEIIGHQEIERYFVVSGQIGESLIDPVAKRVVVTMPKSADLAHLTLESIKLGPAGITTLSPDIKPGPIDLEYPMNVEVTCHGRTQIWTLYAQFTDSPVTTTQVDAWSKVIWAYGAGPAEGNNGFEYHKVGESSWTKVPENCMVAKGSVFSCYIPHLEPLTEYVVRATSDDYVGEEITVKTDGTEDIPNGDFENWWRDTSNKNMWCPWAENGPRFWDTGNKGSNTLGESLTVPSDHTPTGSGLSVQCTTKFVGIGIAGKLGAGSIFSGEYLRTEGTNGVLAFGQPWTLRPTSLKGYYQYNAAPIDYASSDFKDLKGQPDTCHIYVALTDWTAPYEIRTKASDRQLFNKNASYVIAYGELVYSGHMSQYQPFEIKLNYRDTSRVPTYLQITATASKYGDYFTGGNGSVLYVDQFSFEWDLP